MVAGTAGSLWHFWSLTSASSKRIVVDRDSADAAASQTHAQGAYDPYFLQVNHTTRVMLLDTNAVSRNP